MPPIIRNTFIRIVAFFDRTRNIVTQLLKQIVSFLARLLGFTNPGYYIDADEAQRSSALPSSGQTVTQSQSAEAGTISGSKYIASSRSQSIRSKAEIDSFRAMARQLRERK